MIKIDANDKNRLESMIGEANKMHKNNIGPIIFIFLFLTGYTEFIKSTDNMRNIAIFSDVQSRISPGKNDIVTRAFIAAIYERNPIIVSKSIWNDFVTLRKNFYAKSQEKKSLEQKYNNLFKKINLYLSETAEQEGWNETKLKQSLSKQITNEKTEFHRLYNNFLVEDLLSDEYYHESPSHFTYFAAPLYSQSWNAYVLPTFILLIPKQYKKNLKRQLKNQMNNLLNFGKKKGFSEEEIILGLKTQKLTKMKGFSDKYELPIMETTEILDAETIKSDLHKIFITKKDLNLPKPSDSAISFLLPHKWNIFLIGHGGYKKEPELETIQQNLKTLYKKVGYIRSDLTQEKLKEMSAKYPGLLKKDQDGLSKIDIMNEIINNEKKLLKIITTSKFGVVAGMTIQQLKTLLAFSENNLDVSFLHYVSCYATGEKTDLIYTTHGITDIYHFTISASVATDIATKPGGIMKQNFIFNFNKSATFFIEKDEKRVTIQPKILLQLNKFYQALKYKNTPYEKLISYVNFDKVNIPVIRFPVTHWLNIAKLDNVMDLSRIRTSIAAAKGSITLYPKHPDKNKKKFKLTNYVILHTPYMPFKINIEVPIADKLVSIPLKFISLLSNQVSQPTHYIKSISAQNLYLHDIVSICTHFSRIRSPKLFLIENLRCRDDKTEEIINFKYVIIINNSNVFSQNKIYNGVIFNYPNEQTATQIVREIIPKTLSTPRKLLKNKTSKVDSDTLIQKFNFFFEKNIKNILVIVFNA